MALASVEGEMTTHLWRVIEGRVEVRCALSVDGAVGAFMRVEGPEIGKSFLMARCSERHLVAAASGICRRIAQRVINPSLESPRIPGGEHTARTTEGLHGGLPGGPGIAARDSKADPEYSTGLLVREDVDDGIVENERAEQASWTRTFPPKECAMPTMGRGISLRKTLVMCRRSRAWSAQPGSLPSSCSLSLWL